jgi:hypothetical protein
MRAAAIATLVILLISLDLRFYIPLRVGNLRGLYGISRERMLPLQQAGLEHALVVVHPSVIWTEYGSLLTLAPPFAEGDLLLAYTRGPEVDGSLAELYPDYRLVHYYTDDPEHFHEAPR